MNYKRSLGLNNFEAFEYFLIQEIIRPIAQKLFYPLEKIFQKKNFSIAPLQYLKFYSSILYVEVLFIFLIKYGGKFKKKFFLHKGKEIIFSLASIKGRENSLKFSLKSLILQKTPFHSINVFLPEESLSILKKDKKLFNIFLKEKVVFNIKDNSLGTHRKYIFNYELHQKFHMCLVDDDYFYDRWVLTDLVRSSILNNSRVVSLYRWKAIWAIDKKYPEPRRNWKKSLKNPINDSCDLLTYVDDAYTLYESCVLKRDFFNIENIKKLCTMKVTCIVGFDDDWIKWNLYKNNVKVGFSRRWSLINGVTEHIKIQNKNNHAYLSNAFDDTDKVVLNIINFLGIS